MMSAHIRGELGLKYRFSVDRNARIGWRLKLSFDRNRVSLQDNLNVLETPDHFEFQDLRLGTGISFYF